MMILKNLIFNEDYARKVLPFIKSEYFSDRTEKTIFNVTQDFILEYNNIPTYESLVIITKKLSIKENELESCLNTLNDINKLKEEKSNQEWLITETEKFCQEKAVYNAIMQSIQILDNKV